MHRNLPITSIHPFAKPAAIAGICAAEQGAFAGFYAAVFEHQDSIGNLSWPEVAAAAGASDSAAFARCFQDGSALAILRADSIAAEGLKVSGTPTLLVEGTLISGAIPADSIIAILRQHED